MLANGGWDLIQRLKGFKYVPLDGFQPNLIMQTSLKIQGEIPNLVKTRQKYRALHTKILVCFPVTGDIK